MDKTSLGILDNHVQEINKSTDSKSTNDILLKTVKLLLDNVEYSSDVLAKYSDKIEMRKLFSSFGRSAQSACDFYQASKSYLDPDALNGELGRKLDANIAEIAKVNIAIKSIEENEATLLNKENELNDRKETYVKLNEKISTLKEIEEKVTIEILNKLKHEAEELDLHLGENSNIVVKLKEYDISSVQKFLDEIERRKDIIKNEIKWFDNILKDIIAEQERRNESVS